jgi:nicotinamide N-methyltransferase
LAAFFDAAQERDLCVETIYEEDSEGNTRVWDPTRGNGTEDHTERKRWLVIARLMRRQVVAQRRV